MNKILNDTLLLCLCLLMSCTHENDNTAFTDTVEFYHNCGDSLKMKSAQYLYEHSRFHYGIDRHFNKPMTIDFNSILESQENRKDSIFQTYLDSLGYMIVSEEPVMDSDTITEAYLRNNIDLAFEAWNSPWSRDVSFHDFCKYILPYRNGDEKLSDWRNWMIKRYASSIIDSVADPSSLPQVIEYLMRQIRRDVEYGGSMALLNRELLPPNMIRQLHWVACGNCAHYVTLAMRACGVPCAMIKINWRFTEVSHSSVLFPNVGSNPKSFRLNIGDTLIYMGEPKDTMAAWRVCEYDYSVNKERLMLYNTYRNHTQLRMLAWPLTCSDITSQFSKTYNFALQIPDSLRKNKYLFLCRFHYWKWLPIREGLVDGDSVYFHNATIRQWYRLGYASGDSVCSIGNTFTLLGNEDIPNIEQRIRPYDLTGDTILFRLAYRDKINEQETHRNITTYYWDETNSWHALTGDAQLWGFNSNTGEYRPYNQNLLKQGFQPDFYLMDVRLPRWTVFYDNHLGNAFGFVCPDPETNEAILMQF